jgi:acyl carrier protein
LSKAIGYIGTMQDYETILKQIYELLNPLVEKGIDIQEASDFVTDLGFDSLKVMKLLEKVEDHYDISIPLNILPDIQTVEDFVVQIQRLISN